MKTLYTAFIIWLRVMAYVISLMVAGSFMVILHLTIHYQNFWILLLLIPWSFLSILAVMIATNHITD